MSESEHHHHHEEQRESSGHHHRYSESSGHHHGYSDSSGHHHGYSESSGHHHSYSESSDHHHGYSESSDHHHGYSESSRHSSGSSSKHSSHHRHHRPVSTTGGYRTAGPADTTPITIAGMEETARDDRLSLHVFDPNAPHGTDTAAEARHAAHKKAALRRKFRQNFLKILLYILAAAAALAVLWIVIRTVGSPKPPSSEGAVIGEVVPISTSSGELPTA